MVFSLRLVSGAVAAAIIALSSAHPGEHHDHDEIRRSIAKRDIIASNTARSLERCANVEAHKQLKERTIARRAETARELRIKRGLSGSAHKYRRDLATLQAFEEVNHNMTGMVDVSYNASPELLFGANTSCVLTPEVTAGPYYVTGEMIRKNVKESKYSDGVDLFLQVQYIDIETCLPVPDVFVDIWNSNATGVYSGIAVTGNEAADGYSSTYLRGIQFTDADGVAEFESIFPGHYDGRATHTHLLAHMNVTVYPNRTINAENNITHIGQLFYQEDLRSAVEATYPYNANTQPVTSNDDDMWEITQTGTTYDPFPEYVYLGDDVTDGLMAWIQIGVNVSADYIDDEYYATAAHLWADGGHAEENSLMGGGGVDGNMTMNGTMPEGTMSGTPPDATGSAPASG